MSTVLWANHLAGDGQVTSDERDKWALYKHADRLDTLARRAKLGLFTSLLDHTDAQFNLSDAELPEGMRSTRELMARDGVWQRADDALAILDGLLAIVRERTPRFGLLKNDYDDVVAELAESSASARTAADAGAKFNFSVVT
jgi:hypothetical protein